MGKTISGVKLDSVNDTILSKYCAKYGVVRTGSLGDDVALLVAKIRSTTPKPKVAECDVCGGDSSVDDDECPYCGSGGFDQVAPTATPPASVGDVKEVVQAAKSPPALSEPVIVTSKDKAKPKGKGKGKSKAEAIDELKAVIVEEVAAAEEIEEAPKGEAHVYQPDMMSDEFEDYEDEVPSEDALVPVVVTEAKIVTGNIDDAVEAVREAKRLAVVCYWQFGQAILKCFEGDLWKQKRDANGQPLYKGFYQFCEGELGLSGRYCYSLMDIASNFSSQDVAEIGVAKLGIMVRLPEEQRVKLLDEVRNGVSYSQLSSEVKKLQAESGPREAGDSRTAKATEASAKKKLTAKLSDSTLEKVITCTHDITRSRIPLFIREDNVVDSKKNQPKRAKRLADDPWGEEISSNGIVIRYSLTMDANGDLVIVVERRRTE